MKSKSLGLSLTLFPGERRWLIGNRLERCWLSLDSSLLSHESKEAQRCYTNLRLLNFSENVVFERVTLAWEQVLAAVLR